MYVYVAYSGYYTLGVVMRVLCAEGPRDAINHSANDDSSFVSVSSDRHGREQ